MSLINQVYDTLKLKKGDAFCAEKLGISLDQYKTIKEQILSVKGLLQDDIDEVIKDAVVDRLVNRIDENALINNYVSSLEDQLTDAFNQQREKVIEFKEDLEEGTAQIKGVAFAEPKSPEEIIRILKIDTEKWKLSSYWNKQHRDYWLVSAMVTQKTPEKEDLLKTVLEQFKPRYQQVELVHVNKDFETPTVGVLSLQDLHFGKENNESITEDFKAAIKDLVHRGFASHQLDTLVYVVGGDLLNMDNFQGGTTKGTPVENCMRAQDAYTEAFDALFWSINYLKQFCNRLKVIYLPGNHDRLSSYHIAHALSKCFEEWTSIDFDVTYSERKVFVYGSNFFGFEHGDVNSKNSPLLYATEFSEQWGQTRFRTVYTGHFHTKKTVEYKTENEVHGFAIKHLPSLSKSDYWHYHNKYTGSKRQAILEIHHPEKGKISELIYTA